MRAARFYGKEDIRVDEVPEPQDDGKSVIVDVEWCGICGSDLHEFIQGILSAFARDSSLNLCKRPLRVADIKNST